MTTTAMTPSGNISDGDYRAFLNRLQDSYANLNGRPLFTTDAELWPVYLAAFPEATRQHHNCSACRRFIERFGGLVTIDDAGVIAPAFWRPEDADVDCINAVAAMVMAVRRARVTGVFLCSEKEWGTRVTGDWIHLSLVPASGRVFERATQTAGQAMAEKRQDYINVNRALDELNIDQLTLAVRVLKSDALYRSEKVLGAAEWLHSTYAARMTARGQARANLVWLAVAEAPAGFCHPRASMIGTLLEDIAAGMDFDAVSRRFAAKMHPLAYQRPQAAPTAGAIAQAEKTVAAMGAAGSLARRYCRADEVVAIWRPAPTKPARADAQCSACAGKGQLGTYQDPGIRCDDCMGSGRVPGVFGHLTPKGREVLAMAIPAQAITFAKFRAEVLPTAERIEVLAPAHGHYACMTTAVNADAPPIIQWDTPERRNPVSWYLYVGGSTAEHWGLASRGVSSTWHPVLAISLSPAHWHGGNEHHATNAILVIAGARDSTNRSACLFPEILKSEFHGIRSVIEAYSNRAKLEDESGQHAAGLMIGKNSGASVRVWVGSVSSEYRIDRWD